MRKETKPDSGAAESQAALSPHLRRQLDRYFLACSATTIVVVAGGVHDAKAAIIYSGTKNVSIPALNAAGIYFDFDTNTFSPSPSAPADANLFDVYGTGTYNGQAAFYHGVSFFGPNNAINNALATLTTTLGETLKLGAGVTVGPNPSSGVFGRENDLANQWYTGAADGTRTGPLMGQWSSGGTGFLGFRFVDKNGQTDYGWMRISFDPTNFLNQQISTVVIDWAYNNSGGPILTGQIPEPSSIALAFLGAGAVGLALWRQRRQQSQDTPQA
ncbi:MAG: hypothetical protein QOI34_1450 [Verrucomicrobiota bacterium]|jgi:hypothetical protein